MEDTAPLEEGKRRGEGATAVYGGGPTVGLLLGSEDHARGGVRTCSSIPPVRVRGRGGSSLRVWVWGWTRDRRKLPSRWRGTSIIW